MITTIQQIKENKWYIVSEEGNVIPCAYDTKRRALNYSGSVEDCHKIENGMYIVGRNVIAKGKDLIRSGYEVEN